MIYERKVMQTIEQLKTSMVQLMLQKKFDDVTIADIVKYAGVTRSTFYRYFDDKYELISAIEDDIIEHIQQERGKSFRQAAEVHDVNALFQVETLKQLFHSLDDYADAINVLVRNNGENSFEMKLKNVVFKRIKIEQQDAPVSQLRQELGKEFVVSILIKTFQYWSKHKDTISLEDLAEVHRDLYLNGIIKVVKG